MEKKGCFLLILLVRRQKQQEMSYYQPFYYPYFSARADLPPSLQQLHRKYAEIPIPAESALVQQQARRIEMQGYPRSHYARAELQRMNEERRIEAEVAAQMEFRRETDYLERIAALRRERELLEVRHQEGTVRERYELQSKEKQQATMESYMTDEELLRHYATGQKYSEYQRDVKEKLMQGTQAQRQPGIAAKVTYSHETENSPAKIERRFKEEQKERQSDRKNQSGKSQREDPAARELRQQRGQREQMEREQREREQREREQRERDRAVEAFKRSYIDQLNESKGHSIEKNSNYLKPRGQTIEIIPRSQLDMPFLQHRYGVAPKKTKKRRGNQSVSHALKKKPSKNISQFASNRTFTAVTASEAMKKINNRLKVSAIVYKDSKLRNQRHQIDHLCNTFQAELKGRKDVKERINNNPDVMKKHNMVVEYS